MDDEFLMNFQAGRAVPGQKRIPKMSLRMSALAEVSGHIDRFVEPDLEVSVMQQRGWRWLCMGG
jgi:hypothetical protein